MNKLKNNSGQQFLVLALILLVLALVFGVLAAVVYLIPDFLKDSFGFSGLRPLHVSSALFWIILGASGCVYSALQAITGKPIVNMRSSAQILLWIFALLGIYFSYFSKQYGGREYWEFNPIWSLPIVFAWVLFLINFIVIVKKIKNWPVYIWMWLTGIVFFLFIFLESYLWVFPYFRSHFITDMTIQWKASGSLVGAWNQILYGTAFYLMDKIEGKQDVGKSKLAFAAFFLGLINLMFNWGHHVYTLPTANYVRYVGYAVSMTEWIFFIKIFYDWKKSINTLQKNYHYFPFRFLMMADVWVLINLTQALLMSIPAINIYTHGTHITVAHAMGTTIGINSMIILACCFEFIAPKKISLFGAKFLNIQFWLLQIGIFILWASLNLAGIKKGLWQLSTPQSSYGEMMASLKPYFIALGLGGTIITISLFGIAYKLIQWSLKNNT
ncbi:MAG: cbb3-type cytochrome c oxidase subunit I [Bacteroidota bacterium]